MKDILILKVWRNKISASAGIAAIALTLLWPSIPLRGLDAWLKTLVNLFPTNFLYPILAILIGTFVAIYIYNKKVQSCCSIKSTGTGASASFIGIFLGACPACIPALAFFLPLSATVTLSYFSWAFLLASIAVLTFAIYKMNGFRRI